MSESSSSTTVPDQATGTSEYCIQYATSPLEHLLAPTEETIPGGQGEQLLAFGPEKLPAGHRVIAPPSQEEPAGQLLIHVFAPIEEKVPGRQAGQKLALVPEYVPAAHCVTTPFTQYDPEGQALQVAASAATENVPGGHMTQVLALASEYVPPEHWDRKPFTQYDPAVQAKHEVAVVPEYDVPVQGEHLLLFGPAYVPAAHGVIKLPEQEEPEGQVLTQLLAPAAEKVPCEQGVQVFALAPAKVPAEHLVATPFTQNDPAGHDRQAEDPDVVVAVYVVPVHAEQLSR